MDKLPSGTLEWKPNNQPGKRFLRSAKCPQHNRPGVYRGFQPDLEGKEHWAFACSYLGPKRAHIFLATPDPREPKSPEQMEKWIKSEQEKKVLNKPTRSNS